MKIIDLTQRLPGPLAGKVLTDLGAEVIKIEDIHKKDPFLDENFASLDPSFKSWYEELNSNKKIVRLDFSSPSIKSDIRPYLEGAEGMILPLLPKLIKTLGLEDENLPKPMGVVEMAASRNEKSMHDLNALAQSGLLSLYTNEENRNIVAPPFLPVAGIFFGQQVATQLLANILVARKTNALVKSESYMQDHTESIVKTFWPLKLRQQNKTKFLHNGAYPCYCLYRTADGHYVAVAAVEEHFWTQFTELFQIPMSAEERFSTDPKSFEKIAAVFAKLNINAIETMASNKQLCVSIVRKLN